MQNTVIANPVTIWQCKTYKIILDFFCCVVFGQPFVKRFRQGHTMCQSMVDIQPAAAKIR